jgi:hypothetical protein
MDYTLAAELLSLYILTNLSSGIGSNVTPHLLRGIGKTKIVMKAQLISACILFPLGFYLTDLYGIRGLIFAYIISHFIVDVFKLVVIAKEVKLVPDFKSLIRIYASAFIATIVTSVFLHFSTTNGIVTLIFSCIIFFLSYLTVLPLFGSLNNSDIKIINAMINTNKALQFIAKPIILLETKLVSLLEKNNRPCDRANS